MLLTHRSLHWNLKLWFILFRIPVPSVGENLVRIIKIDRNTRRFIFPEFIGCTESGLLAKRSEYSFFVMMTCVLSLCKNRVKRQDCIFTITITTILSFYSNVLAILRTDSTCW